LSELNAAYLALLSCVDEDGVYKERG
jgi:hypothetical protein